jgi:hypothetical protein
MNPYKIANEIRRNQIYLSNFAYEAFDSLSSEMRFKINAIISSLSTLANEIERKTDEEYFGDVMSSRKNNLGQDALEYIDYLPEDEETEEEYEENLWKEPKEGGQSEGDAMMTQGWEE